MTPRTKAWMRQALTCSIRVLRDCTGRRDSHASTKSRKLLLEAQSASASSCVVRRVLKHQVKGTHKVCKRLQGVLKGTAARPPLDKRKAARTEDTTAPSLHTWKYTLRRFSFGFSPVYELAMTARGNACTHSRNPTRAIKTAKYTFWVTLVAFEKPNSKYS